MKTLNDVIAGLEHCIDSECSGCPYNEMPDGCATDGDALEHLKQYRMMLNGKENEPMTLPEIEWAQGCPVWLEIDLGMLQYSGWAIICYGDDIGVRFIYATPAYKYQGTQFFLPKDDHGDKWNAYRKEYNGSSPINNH